jgi:predicted ArsR family transcriptional regulator
VGTRAWVDPEPAPPLGVSRARVLDSLRAAGNPVGVREIGERTELHPNTVRFHLDGLIRAGLVTRETEERGQPGRPRAVYRTTGGGPGAGSHSYRLLAEILAGLVSAMMPDPVRAATDAGRLWGRYLTDRPAPFHRVHATEAGRRLAEILARLGFVSESGPVPAGAPIRFVHCPFGEVARENQAVVCSLHLGLMQGALAEMAAPLGAARLDPFVEPGLCLAHFSAQGQDGSPPASSPSR